MFKEMIHSGWLTSRPPADKNHQGSILFRRYIMEDRIVVPKLTADFEVETAVLNMLADYQLITAKEDFSLLVTLAQRFAGKKLVFFNSTAQGGGVALMRHALIRLFNLLQVDAH